MCLLIHPKSHVVESVNIAATAIGCTTELFGFALLHIQREAVKYRQKAGELKCPCALKR